MPKRIKLNFVSPIHKAGRQIAAYLEQRLSRFPATTGELHLLSYVRSYGPCPVNELVRVFGFKNTTMTSMLDRLERKGCLTRRTNPRDRRSFIVRITAQGDRVAGSSLDVVVDLDRAILGEITDSDLRGFQNVMAAVSKVSGIELRPTHAEQSFAGRKEKP